MSDGRLGVGESTSNVVFEDAQIIRFILSLEGVGNDCKILHINDTTKSKENEEATCYWISNWFFNAYQFLVSFDVIVTFSNPENDTKNEQKLTWTKVNRAHEN